MAKLRGEISIERRIGSALRSGCLDPSVSLELVSQKKGYHRSCFGVCDKQLISYHSFLMAT